MDPKLVDILNAARKEKAAANKKTGGSIIVTNSSYTSQSRESDPRIQDIVEHVPIDNSSEVYTSTVNKDTNNEPIITPTSTVEDHIYSQRYQAISHGTILPVDIKYVYPNKDFPASLVESSTQEDPYGINYDPSAFHQKLARAALDENFNGELKLPEIFPEWKAFLPDINAWSLVGDPRWTLGYALQGMFQWWWPRVKAYIDYLTNKGLIIKNNYICDADGQQIIEYTEDNLNSLLIQGNPSATADIPKPVTAEEILAEFNRQRINALQKSADAFVEYIRKKYLDRGFFVESYYYHPMRLFVLKCYNLDYKGALMNVKYVKYYHDQIDYIINKLKIPIQQVNDQGFGIHLIEGNLYEDIKLPIPDYIKRLKELNKNLKETDDDQLTV
jgi:hypothetical protein